MVKRIILQNLQRHKAFNFDEDINRLSDSLRFC